jgi:hypothetical protein
MSPEKAFVVDDTESFDDIEYEVKDVVTESYSEEGESFINADAGDFSDAIPPTRNRLRALSDDVDFGFVEFGTYTELPVNQKCEAFSPFDGMNNTINLPIAGAPFGVQRVLLNPDVNPFPWYGFETMSIAITTEAAVLMGPSADPRTSQRFNIAAAVTAGIPLGFGRQGFLPSASDASRIILAFDGEKNIISWENIPFNVNGGSGFMNAQVLLYLNGDIEIRWGPVELPDDFDNGEQLGFFQSSVRDVTYYVQDETVSSGAPIGDGGVWQPGEWPANQCRFLELVNRE